MPHLAIIVIGHALVMGIGAPCAREAPTHPMLCGAILPRVVVALLVGIALLYVGMFRASNAKALSLAGATAATVLAVVHVYAMLSGLRGKDDALPRLMQPVASTLSLLTMIGAWLFTFREAAMRKIFGLTSGET